jgi:hypothetical protein
VKHPAVAVLVALALTGCGGAVRDPGAAAPDRELTEDLVPLTTAQAAHRADRIALVTAGPWRVVEGAPGTPFTRTTFAVERVLKGRLPHRFVVQVIGGRLGDVVVRSPAPAFTATGRYVLFLGPDGPAGPTIFPQSVIEVQRGGPALSALLDAIRRSAR